MATLNRHAAVSSQNGALLNRIADDRGNAIFTDEPVEKDGAGKRLKPFFFDWDLISEEHLQQRSCDRTKGRTHGCFCQLGAVHTWP